jgi:hypothetical protein
MKMKLSLLAAAIAVSPLFAVAQTLPALGLNVHPANAAPPAATFSGGISSNGGANFVNTVPAGQPAGLYVSMKPAAAHVGTQGFLYMVVSDGSRSWMRTPTGFARWNGIVSSLVAYSTKTLAADETISIPDLETFSGAVLDGMNLRINVGYATAASPLAYSTAIIFSMGTALPNPTTCPVGPPAGREPLVPGGKRLCVMSGTYTSDVRLSSNFEYIVSGPVFIGGDNVNPASLTVDPGVTTYGESGADFIRVSRGSKIHVNGTAAAPVIMTGAIDAQADANTTGAWGGLVINGNAPLNGCTAGTVICQAEGEGNSGTYGGNNPTESSGNLNYLIIKYAGFEISPGNELNGLTLNAVGSGTLIDYVQVHNGSDDGFETFGGTVNAKHLVLTGNDDDSLDWQKGWTGKAQHVLVIQKTIGDRGIEADNNSAARDSLPRSKPQIANLTIIGSGSNGNGIKLRDGTAGNIFNTVVKGSGASCVDIDHGPTFTNAGSSATSLTGQLTIVNSMLDCPKLFSDAIEDLWSTEAWFRGQAGNTTGSTEMTSYINSPVVNARPAADLSGDPFFDNVSHIGAVKDEATDWTLGWTFRPPFNAQ